MVIVISFGNLSLVSQNWSVSGKEDEVFLMKFSDLKFIRSYKFIDEEHSAYVVDYLRKADIKKWSQISPANR